MAKITFAPSAQKALKSTGRKAPKPARKLGPMTPRLRRFARELRAAGASDAYIEEVVDDLRAAAVRP